MKEVVIEIDNLKCEGCENRIVGKLTEIREVKSVDINMKSSSVRIKYKGDNKEQEFLKLLTKLGYPKKGTTTSFQKAKSYLSCAVGKLKKEN